MSRGKAEFSVGKMIDVGLSSDFKQPKFEHKLDVSYDSKGDDKYYELDPVTRINKGFSFEDDLEVKEPDDVYGVPTEGNKKWDEVREENIKQQGNKQFKSKAEPGSTMHQRQTQGNIFTNMRPGGQDARAFRMKEPPISSTQKIKSGFTDMGSKISQGVSGLKNRFSSLSTPGKIGVIGAIGAGLAGIGYKKSNSEVLENPQYKELSEEVVDKAFSVRDVRNTFSKVKNDVGAVKNRWGTPLAIGSVTGVIGGDIANRIQDRRNKKNQQGLVTSIVDELKRNKE